MEITALLETRSKDAESIAASLRVDNAGFEVKTKAAGGRIVSEVRSENIGSLISTLDDIVNCQIVAEKTIG